MGIRPGGGAGGFEVGVGFEDDGEEEVEGR